MWHSVSRCHAVCVRVYAALVSAVKVMCCIQCSLVIIINYYYYYYWRQQCQKPHTQQICPNSLITNPHIGSRIMTTCSKCKWKTNKRRSVYETAVRGTTLATLEGPDTIPAPTRHIYTVLDFSHRLQEYQQLQSTLRVKPSTKDYILFCSAKEETEDRFQLWMYQIMALALPGPASGHFWPIQIPQKSTG